jgi:predicted transcriptional regulator
MPTDRPSPSRASAPRLEEAEEGVIRSMEASGRSVQPSVYDALSSTRDGNEGKPKPKPSFARLVRKVMVEQQQVRKEGSPSPGHHRRGSSNAQIYNLLQKMRDNESEPVLGDAFQNHFFFKEEESSLSDIAERSEDPLEGEDPVQAFGFTDGNGDRPMDSTPLLARRRGRKETKSFCDAASVQRFFWDIFLHCWLLVVAAAMAGVAIVLFYKFENPEIDALPGNATVAWWCNFGARLIVILEVSRVLKFLVIDCLVLGGGLSVKYMGAFITLLSLQAKDWPFVLSAWGILNAIFLHGDNKFNNHWLYGTGWEIYSMASNSGLRIIASDTYLRLLLCMIVVGVATALKRTFLAISFGRRQYSIFKPRLEKLLLDVVLLNEVASLSAELDGVEMQGSTSTKPAGKAKRGAMGDVSWDSVKMKQEEEEDSETEQAEEEKGTYSRSSSEGSFLKQLLDRWEEPTSQQDRVSRLKVMCRTEMEGF